MHRSLALRPLLHGFVEGLHTVLLTVVDAVESSDPMHRDLLRMITGDRGELMERMRRTFLRREGELGYGEQQTFFAITSLFEQIVWLARRLSTTLEEKAEG